MQKVRAGAEMVHSVSVVRAYRTNVKPRLCVH